MGGDRLDRVMVERNLSMEWWRLKNRADPHTPTELERTAEEDQDRHERLASEPEPREP